MFVVVLYRVVLISHLNSYVPVVAAVMFWPVPIAPMMNFSKGVKKEGVVA